VASLGGGGWRTARMTPDVKLIFVAEVEFRKNTEHWINDVGRWEWRGDDSCKKGHHFHRRWL